jgi:hypothetical protein
MTDDDRSSGAGKLQSGAFVLGGLSFIPLLGVPLGIAVIIWGLVTKKIGAKKLALIGLGGILSSVLLYGGLFYFGFVQRGGIYDSLRVRLAQSMLTSLVPAIEYYKIQHGGYPLDLDTLRKSLPKDSFISVSDPTDVRQPKNFYYERVGNDHYYLRSVGPDGEPFTADDILPEIDQATSKNLGLLLDRQK